MQDLRRQEMQECLARIELIYLDEATGQRTWAPKPCQHPQLLLPVLQGVAMASPG